MLNQADEMQEADRPDIRQLLERASAEARSWAEAEVMLAQSEIAALRAQAARLLGLGLLAAACAVCALVAFSQAGIAFLTPMVDGPGVAALIVGGVLLLVLGVALLAMRGAFAWRTESIFLRWFGRQRPRGGRS